MNHTTGANRAVRAAIILAGGEGTRLRELTRQIAGFSLPKQFCPIIGNTTLLEQTRKRVSLAVEPDNTLLVLTKTHDRFYAPLVIDMPPKNMVIQPENRGTAPAVLYSLLRLASVSSQASVALFPSDHYVDDGAKFMRHAEMAFEAVEARPELTVLLGITPDNPETGYGWIEPGRRIEIEKARIFSVRRFWEKPLRTMAEELLIHGCMWNSFVMVARISTLLGLMTVAMPSLYARFGRIRPRIGSSSEEQAVRAIYAGLPTANFSEEVLAKFPMNLGVLPVCGVQWSDLGEPQRVMKALTRMGIRPRWAAA